jgi:hypothetical protein
VPAVTDSTATDSTATDSTATDSTATDSTATDSTATDTTTTDPVTETPVAPATQTLTFTVWPDRQPTEHPMTDLDEVPLQEVNVEAGTVFYVKLEEIMYFPNGFAFEEPAMEDFSCVTVLSKNYGNFNTGYRVWMIEAKEEVCNEEVELRRPTWWSDAETTDTLPPVKLIINVSPITCDQSCEPGLKRASATSCQCLAIETEPAQGELFMTHQIAHGATVRIWMKKDDAVTLREFSQQGSFVYNIAP